MYRERRNIEASLIDKLSERLATDSWSVRVEKAFARVYEGSLPCLLINVSNLSTIQKEIGTKTKLKEYEVSFRIFSKDDGNRLDLADWLTNELENDFDYIEHDIQNGSVGYNVKNGKINILKITDNRKELENTENLAKEDRYRHLIKIICRLSKSE